jgi:hypothetical protein
VRIGESDALRRKRIDIRGFDETTISSVDIHVADSQVVGEDEDDVGFRENG